MDLQHKEMNKMKHQNCPLLAEWSAHVRFIAVAINTINRNRDFPP